MSSINLTSKLKSRVAKALNARVLTLNYGISLCNKDYSEEELQDDLFHIDILSSGKGCESLRFQQLRPLTPNYPAFPPASDPFSPFIFPGEPTCN